MTTASAWPRALLMLTAAWLAILALFVRDALHLADLWWNASTYTHCLIILPVIGWLVWLRRHELVKLVPAAWLYGLGWIALGAFAWLLGDAAGVALLRHAGLIVMLQGCVPALLGPHVARGLAFPLFYSLFLIPFGDELVPPMQLLTADMAMVLLRLSAIPAHIDGIFIAMSGGYFAVAEACSGVKFLVAMAALAVLAAHLCFTRLTHRLAFIAFALLACVLANGVRAFGTIAIAENWGTDFAAGADHIIYGWLFFAAVIASVAWAASPWFDRDPEAVGIDGDALASARPHRPIPAFPVALAAFAIAVAPIGWSLLASTSIAPIPALDPPAAAGWQIAAATPAEWQARFDGADRRGSWQAADGRGPPVDIVIVGYAGQDEGREIVGFGQGAVDPDSDWRWGQSLDPIGSAPVARIVRGSRHRDVLTAYVMGGTLLTSPRAVKLATLRARLTGGDQRAYALLLSAPGPAGRGRIAAFITASGGLEPLVLGLTAP
jgi:exosortase A